MRSLSALLAPVCLQERELAQRCLAMEMRERAAVERARLAEDRGTALTLELARTKAEVRP